MDQPTITVEAPVKLPKGARAAAIRRDKRRYPDLGPSALAKRAGCSRQNASRVLSSFLTPHTDEELRDYQENKADILDAKGYQLIESMTQKKIEKMSAGAAAVAFGILFDKRALLVGDATSNVNVRVLLDVAGMIRRDGEQ
jgi:hypothetical protein